MYLKLKQAMRLFTCSKIPVILTIPFWLLVSCTGTKNLGSNEYLYTGHELEFHSDEKIEREAKVRAELEPNILPKPNGALFNLRPRLWLYNTIDSTGEKGIKYWLKYKLGKRPVLLDSTDPERTKEILAGTLENMGYFNATVKYDLEKKGKEAKIIYNAFIGKPYYVDSVSFPVGNSILDREIRQTESGTLVKEGEIYNLGLLKKERQRIDLILKNQGYFYFNPDFLIFKADSTTGKKREVDLYLRVKPQTPPKAKRKYRINDIFIFQDYAFEEDRKWDNSDTIMVQGYHYFTRDSLFRPSVIAKAIFYDTGDFYSFNAHDLTLTRLMSLGVFKFVNIRYREIDSAEVGQLDVYIYLTPIEKKSLRVELQATTKSNGFTGPNLIVGFRNRNALRGAELFIVNARGGFESQIFTTGKNYFSYELGLSSSIEFPRFITPFNIHDVSSRYMPRTRISGGFTLLNRVRYYMLNSFDFKFGYIWQEVATKKHELNPLYINLTNLINTTPVFDSILTENPYFRQSFEEQFIIGPTYTFTYNQQVRDDIINPIFFKGSIEFSGNIVHLANLGLQAGSDTPYTLLTLPYSQYIRPDIDLRYYHKLKDKQKLAFRFLAGVGFSYGNSRTLPYIKQFFSGGTNSIRAFRARSIGPGSFESENENSDRIFYFENSGDIRLEGNIEYRFPILAPFNGAVFLDAGNVWMLRNDSITQKPGGTFYLTDKNTSGGGSQEAFYRQIAIGTGFGIRLDVSFFVLRLDLGIKIRKPSADPGERWVRNYIPFTSGYDNNNLVLNLAIGYPF